MRVGNGKMTTKLKAFTTSFFKWTSDPSLDKTLIGFCKKRKIDNPRKLVDWIAHQYLEWFYESSSVKVISCFMAILIPFVIWIEKENISTVKGILAVLLERSEAIALILAVILFFKEARNRKRQSQYLAWQVIDNAIGNSASYARYQALQDLNSDNIKLEGLNSPDADLPGINLKGAFLARANLKKAYLADANLTSSNLSWVDLTDADLTSAILKSSQSYKAILKGVKLANAKLNNSRFNYADFSKGSERSVLDNVDCSYAELVKCNFDGASLVGATFYKTCCNANLVNTDLSYAHLEESDFSDSDLSQATLCYAEIINTDFKHADLSYANLRDASLINVDFENANLDNADLQGVDLSHVNLNNANLNDAKLDFFVHPDEKPVLAKAKNLPPNIKMQLDVTI
jgi:uncharacterized protein YjbI with pentapeptide repeats